MTLLRRVSYGALALAFAHIVFGAIVRITGSGLGCGDHWPKCHGYWFPPFTRMDLVIEVMHRYLAFGLSLTIAGLLVLAFTRRREPGVGGPGGVLRPVALAAVLVVSAALFGALTVKFELRNKGIIVIHLAIAISTLAALAMATIRAGGLGGAQATPGTASEKTWRGARVAAALAFAAVVLGGFTAHIVGANGACVGFPHCPRGIPTPGAPLHVHLTHRVVAFLLFFHLLGMVFAVRKRGESALMQWAVRIAFGTVLLQILVAAALVELFLPAVLRSLHQAVGTLVWLSIFVLAVLARRGSRGSDDGARLVPPAPQAAPDPGALPRGAATVATVVANVAASAMVAAPVATPVAEASAEPVAAARFEPVTPVEDAAAVAIDAAPDEVLDAATDEHLDAEVAEVAEVVAPAPVIAAEAVVEEDAVVATAPVEAAGLDEVEDEAQVEHEVVVEAHVVVEADPEPVAATAPDDFDREVAKRLEAVVGRDPFEDADELVAVEDQEIDADDDFAAAIAAEFGDDEEAPEQVEAAAPEVDEARPEVEVEVAVQAVVEQAAAPVIPADVAVLPSVPKRPPTLAVLIARGADL